MHSLSLPNLSFSWYFITTINNKVLVSKKNLRILKLIIVWKYLMFVNIFLSPKINVFAVLPSVGAFLSSTFLAGPDSLITIKQQARSMRTNVCIVKELCWSRVVEMSGFKGQTPVGPLYRDFDLKKDTVEIPVHPAGLGLSSLYLQPTSRFCCAYSGASSSGFASLSYSKGWCFRTCSRFILRRWFSGKFHYRTRWGRRTPQIHPLLPSQDQTVFWQGFFMSSYSRWSWNYINTYLHLHSTNFASILGDDAKNLK